MRITISHAPSNISSSEGIDPLTTYVMAGDLSVDTHVVSLDTAGLRALAALCTRVADDAEALAAAKAEGR